MPALTNLLNATRGLVSKAIWLALGDSDAFRLVQPAIIHGDLTVLRDVLLSPDGSMSLKVAEHLRQGFVVKDSDNRHCGIISFSELCLRHGQPEMLRMVLAVPHPAAVAGDAINSTSAWLTFLSSYWDDGLEQIVRSNLAELALAWRGSRLEGTWRILDDAPLALRLSGKTAQ